MRGEFKRGWRELAEEKDEPQFCLGCPKRDTCRRICKPLEAYLKVTCGTRRSVSAKCFTDLPDPGRRALAEKFYGRSTALDSGRSVAGRGSR